MAKLAPTLADQMIREWSRSAYRRIDPDGWLPLRIAQARKFVLDEGMSAFMADLGYASLNACRTAAKKHELIEGMRKLSRLPHALTWIEFDKQAHRRRVKEVYHPEIEAEFDSVPDRSGWLLQQHSKLDSAFMAIHCTSHAWVDAGRVDTPNCSQFAFAWTCDDTIPPWPRDPFYHRTQRATMEFTGGDRGMVTPAGVLAGVASYDTECVSIIPSPNFSLEAAEAFKDPSRWRFNPLGELAHDLRYLWSLLATVNELPTSSVVIKPAKGHMVRGSYRRFSEHTVISLTVPAKRYQTVAKRALASARRRGHQVRGHFRKDHWHPGERIWIREHVRGDTSRGFVLHDYTVSHENAP